ncbi:hypothetical protein OC861_006516 [Tilletia horrida]|nr:hypothetical protein OC861_006516 [Tilletia horrida]
MAGNTWPCHRFLYSDSKEEDEDSDSDALAMGSSSATSPRTACLTLPLEADHTLLAASRNFSPSPSWRPPYSEEASYPAPSPVVVDPSGYLLKLGAKGQMDNDPQELDEEKIDYSSETATIVDEGERGRTAPVPSVQSATHEFGNNQSNDTETTKAKANTPLHPASQRLMASSSSDERSCVQLPFCQLFALLPSRFKTLISSSTLSSSLCSLDFDGAGNPVSPSGRLERGRSPSRSGPGSSSSLDRLSDAAQGAYASSLASGTDFGARSRSRGSSSSSSLQSWGSCQMSDRPRGGARGGEESMSPLGSTSTRASLSTGAVGAAGPRRHGEHGSRAERGTNSGRRPPAARAAPAMPKSRTLRPKAESLFRLDQQDQHRVLDVVVRTSPRSVQEGRNDDSTPVLTPRRSLAGSSKKGEVDVDQSNSGDDSTPNLAKSKNRSRAGSTSGSGTDVPGQKDRTASNATLSPHPRIGSAAILSANSSPTPAPGTPVGPEPPTTSTSSETAARAAVESKSAPTISPGVGVGGATPGNTPRVRTGKRRSNSAAGGSATAAAAAAAAVKGHRRTGSASSMPAGHRRSSSSTVPDSGGSGTGSSASNKPYGALVVPRDPARAGVMGGVPLAPEYGGNIILENNDWSVSAAFGALRPFDAVMTTYLSIYAVY